MKIKHCLIIITLAYCLDFLGGLIKILHSPNADNILIIATTLKIVGFVLLLYKILTNSKCKEFLN